MTGEDLKRLGRLCTWVDVGVFVDTYWKGVRQEWETALKIEQTIRLLVSTPSAAQAIHNHQRAVADAMRLFRGKRGGESE